LRSERTIRNKPAALVFTYMLEILRSLNFNIEQKTQRFNEKAFSGAIHGRMSADPTVQVEIHITGKPVPWKSVAGNFIPSIHTAKIEIKTWQTNREGDRDADTVKKLHLQINQQISNYMWHTSG